MKEEITENQLITYFNEHIENYKCPFCKISQWNLISPSTENATRYFYGLANYRSEAQNEVTMSVPNFPLMFATLVCKNCGYIALISEKIILGNIQKEEELEEVKSE